MRLQRVQSASQLLKQHEKLVATCESISDVDPRYWNALYLPVIESAADYFQTLSLDRKATLLENALNRARETLQRLRDIDGGEVPPIRKYSCFLCALLLEGAVPAQLNVEVDRDSNKVNWNPAIHHRISDVGNFYVQLPVPATIRNDSSLCPILALPLLPSKAKNWLMGDLEEFRIWTATLAGSDSTPIAPIVGREQNVIQRYRSPKDRIRPFIDHLKSQIAARRINRPESALHVVMEGLFLAIPVAFIDYDACGWQATRTDLLAADVLVPPAEGNLWIYRESVSSRKQRTLQGLVLDCSRIGLDISARVNPRLLPVSIA